MPLGRRDSRTASRARAEADIPSPIMDLPQLVQSFENQGLNAKDLVALSGGHSIGFSQCGLFRNRIYGDDNINPKFASQRQKTCPREGGDSNLAPLDQTARQFDNKYYSNLVDRKGLLISDQALFSGGETDELVKSYSKNAGDFSKDFANSMVKMGNIKPLTGRNGQIRVNCRRAN